MDSPRKILLVEGISDKGFFEQICKLLGLDSKVTIAPPTGLGGKCNTKEGVLNHLPTLLLNELNKDSNVPFQLAIVVDADYQENGSGYQRTFARIQKIVKEYDFILKNNSSIETGLYFKNTEGFEDLGVWIMPDNHSEGMLEDWIKNCIIDEEQALFQHASKTVANLGHPKFKEIHRTKAEIATWLAWQKCPGHGLYNTITKKKKERVSRLLNEQHPSFQALTTWLQHIFK